MIMGQMWGRPVGSQTRQHIAKHRKPRSRLSVRSTVILAMVVLLAFGSAASASPRPTEQPVISPGVPVTEYWPPRDEAGIPNSVFEYRLTDHYWKAFRACRVELSFQQCKQTVPAQFVVVRIR